MNRPASAFLSLLPAALVPALVGAQGTPLRRGFWWGAGVGYASWHFAADSGARRHGDRGAGQGYVAAGVTIDPHWTLGLEGALGRISGADAGLSSLSAVVTWYPWTARGWFVRGGFGTSGYRESSGAEAPDYRGSGPGYVATVGVDVPTTGGLSLTPAVTWRCGSIGTVGLSPPGVDLATGFRQRTLGVTLGVTFP
jgi:hypothetical protein